MFIKHGDGKITDIIKGEDLTEDQKEVVKELSKEEEEKDKSKSN